LAHHPNEVSKGKKGTISRSPFRRSPVGILSVQELSEYNGANDGRILISICGRILDMTRGRDFYGPEGPYHVFAGCDATYLLGSMSTEPQCCNKRNFGQWDPSWVSEYTSTNPGLKIPYCDQSTFATDALEGWLSQFLLKYPVVGKLRGFMDVCEESWNRVSHGYQLAPGHATDENDLITDESESLPQMSLNQLDQSKHVSMGGHVFDVNICSYVYAPITGDFPGALGHDISVAFVKDDFTDQWLDQPITSLDSNQQHQLTLLVRKFRETYPRVGVLNDVSKYQSLEEKQPEEKKSEETQQQSTSQPTTSSEPQATAVNKEEEEEPKNSSQTDTSKDKENDNEWDFIQHSDAMLQNVEKTKGKNVDKQGVQETKPQE